MFILFCGEVGKLRFPFLFLLVGYCGGVCLYGFVYRVLSIGFCLYGFVYMVLSIWFCLYGFVYRGFIERPGLRWFFTRWCPG